MGMREPILPSVIRAQLLEDHECIRALLAQIEIAAEKLEAGLPFAPARFADALGRLRRALDAHNTVEERYLFGLLAQVDAWGPIRRDQMLNEHVEEHLDLLDALELADARSARALVARLRKHMAHEEATFLAATVLRDDTVSVAPSS
jgi:hypothetical protein